MTRLLKNITAIVAIVMIISVIAIPAFASVNALSYNVGWEASDLPNDLYAWATFSYSGGNGNRVHSSATAVTNLGHRSVISEWDEAISASYIGPEKAYSLNIPFVVDCYGSASYN